MLARAMVIAGQIHRLIFPAFVSVGLTTFEAQAAPLTFQSQETRTALLELYTSEGCSSCPPAETWLSKLADAPGLWTDFVPVAFHVDYWDYLGWRDPWSASQFSTRQRAYAQAWGKGNVYTPGFVLNGAEWRTWRASKTFPKTSSARAGVLTVSSEKTNDWQVSFSPAMGTQQQFHAYAALLASNLSSDVRAGENRGRRLEHDFVVLELVKGSLSAGGGVAHGELKLSKKLRREGRLAIAVWVTGANRLEPLQTVGGWLQALE